MAPGWVLAVRDEAGGWRALRTGKPALAWPEPGQVWEAFGLPSRLESLPPGWQEAEKCDYPLQGSMLPLGKGGGPMPTA